MTAATPADFVLYFGPRELIEKPSVFNSLRASFPGAEILGCSTGTVITDTQVSDKVVAAIAVSMRHTKVRTVSLELDGAASHAVGRKLAEQLMADDLAGIMILSDGLNVNGSTLVAGIQSVTGPSLPVGGGLAGDGAAFAHTLVGANALPTENTITALGFYGDRIEINLGAAHGWDFFGPTRRVTRSEGNVLFEMDGKPALDLYERYLGEEAENLPASALLYPLMITNPADPADEVVRTVLAVDREARTMTFAGDIPEGWSARLMRGVFDNLTDGAATAAQRALPPEPSDDEGLALLVSCVGRRLLMGQRTADEAEAATSVLGDKFRDIGFYSYGEIATQGGEGYCGLHNQTMTVMTFREH
ncbi:MAG: FIST C-terminal domain-containing protein [Acidobacteria bacterium]|nr:FIST C-terminal domain-containing protein [Acidobacteriota bacterium]